MKGLRAQNNDLIEIETRSCLMSPITPFYIFSMVNLPLDDVVNSLKEERI